MPSNSSTYPLVSVILTTYNRANLIAESIASVLNQTYHNLELIIIDDGSDDGTREIIDNYNDQRIHYFYESHSGMLGYVRNIGIRKAKGEYIAFQDSDDIWRKDKLEIQIELFNKYPATFYGLSNNNQIGEKAVHPPGYDDLFTGNLFSPFFNESRFHFCGTSLIFKKDVIEKIGLLEESQPRLRELYYFLRMSYEFDGLFTNERLVDVRRHADNTSGRYNVDAHWSMLAIVNDFHQKGMISMKQFRHHAGRCYYNMGLYHVEQKEPTQAWPHFLKFIAMQPLQWKGWARASESAIRSLLSLLNKRTTAS